jgi:hypothetical protein
MKKEFQLLVIVIFGFIIPIAILWQAYSGLSALATNVNEMRDVDFMSILAKAKKEIQSSNDYALFSHIYSEQTNKSSMINKQTMKIAVMQIGFAVISIGIMLIVLGINDGGGEGGGEVGKFKLDFKTGSTGVLIFFVGAVMTTAGGVLKNEYATVLHRQILIAQRFS